MPLFRSVVFFALTGFFASCGSCLRAGVATVGGGVISDAGREDGGLAGTVDDAGIFHGDDGAAAQSFGPGSFTLDGGPKGTGNGVALTPEGYLTINSASIEFHFMWLANHANGWVSKYDTRTGKEVGRYWSVIPKDCSNSEGPPCAGGVVTSLRGNHANSPSRTAIDLYGDVWVANRADNIQSSVTKIATSLETCIDRNGDGKITTSQDKNGDGRISTQAGDGEMIIPSDWANPNEYDECVLFSTPVGGVGPGIAGRAIAIAMGGDNSAGDVWFGHFREHRVYKLSSRNGQPTPLNPSGATYLDLAGFDGPYGATIDGEQRLWLVEIGRAVLALVDTQAGVLVNPQIKPPVGMTCGAYGIGLDSKFRVWLPGLFSGSVACRYDHGSGVSKNVGTWTSFDFSALRTPAGRTLGRPRGIAADDSGNVYMSIDSDTEGGGGAARVVRFDADTGTVKPFATASGPVDIIDATDGQTATSIGISLDSDGHPWVNNYSGNAMRIHRVSGEILRTPQQENGLYTYSDFTGYQLRKFTAPRGSYSQDFSYCSNAQWLQLDWDESLPANTNISAYLRVADTQEGLPTGTRYGPFTSPPIDLKVAQIPNSNYLRVEFVLTTTDGKSAPTLKGFQLKWFCPLG